MAVSTKTAKIVWGASAGVCAFPDCRKELVIEAKHSDDEALVGDLCHIVASSSMGPRGESDLEPEERDKADNLILLCKVHHKCIDDQPNYYSVEKLKEMKKNHENWVKKSLVSPQKLCSPFVLFELAYNIFWLEEHSKFLSNSPLAYSIEYRNYIFQILNRCNKAIKFIDIESDRVKELINEMYCEFESNDESYTKIQGSLYSLELEIRSYFDSDKDKNIMSICRSLVNLLKGKALNEKVNNDSFYDLMQSYLGGKDLKIEGILMSKLPVESLENKLISRIKETL